ncbi:MAG: YybH family protein [Thermoanaerobaculales bacterium]
MRRALVMIGVFGLAVAAAMAQNAPKVDAREDLKRVDIEFCKAAAARGLEGWLAYHATDAVIFPAAGPIVSGLAAIKASYAKSGFTPEGLTWTPVGADVAASGELGYTYGTWEWKGNGPDGKLVVQRGKYATVWKKQADGSWKLVLDIGNEEPPEPPKAP